MVRNLLDPDLDLNRPFFSLLHTFTSVYIQIVTGFAYVLCVFVYVYDLQVERTKLTIMIKTLKLLSSLVRSFIFSVYIYIYNICITLLLIINIIIYYYLYYYYYL